MVKSEVLLRDKLHQYIDKIDSKKVEAMYIMFEEEIESKTSAEFRLTTKEIKELDEQRAKYLAGKSKIYSWEEAEVELLTAVKNNE